MSFARCIIREHVRRAIDSPKWLAPFALCDFQNAIQFGDILHGLGRTIDNRPWMMRQQFEQCNPPVNRLRASPNVLINPTSSWDGNQFKAYILVTRVSPICVCFSFFSFNYLCSCHLNDDDDGGDDSNSSDYFENAKSFGCRFCQLKWPCQWKCENNRRRWRTVSRARPTHGACVIYGRWKSADWKLYGANWWGLASIDEIVVKRLDARQSGSWRWGYRGEVGGL